jgi:signal peptidase I
VRGDDLVRRRTLAALFVMLSAVVVTKSFVLDTVSVSSGSMAPTICTGDVILVDRLMLGRPVRRDDVVTFPGPADTGEMIKRVVAVAGQTVALADAQLLVDGRRVPEPYVNLASIDGVYFGPVTVPPRTVFVMGDDREISIDSRSFGPVPLADIDGRLLRTLWSACPTSGP